MTTLNILPLSQKWVKLL